MACEDQYILLQIYKADVAAYSRAVKALGESRGMTAREFMRRRDIASEALQNCIAVLQSLQDHVKMHGCGLQPESRFVHDRDC